MRELAISLKLTPAQLALAWLLNQGPDIVPIPGARSVARLDENAAAMQVSLAAEEQTQLHQILERIRIQRTRYPTQNMGSVNL